MVRRYLTASELRDMLERRPMTAGERYGMLVTVARAANRRQWTCLCDCGKETAVWTSHLRRGATKSCGCARQPHGHYAGNKATPTYSSWSAMRQRCANPNDPSYEHYGARGIKCCERWDSFENFLADMGERPDLTHSLDRVDVDGDYTPTNCRWASVKQQARNTRRTVRLTLNGITKAQADWSDDLGLPSHLIACRLRQGWSVERALSTPKRIYGSKGQ